MKKRIFAGMLSSLIMVSMMVMPVAATATEVNEKQLYSVTVDAGMLANGGSAYKNVNLSLALGGYANGWSTGVAANFSTLPSNARVENIVIEPGSVSAGGPITSAIVATKFAVTSPSGKQVQMTFNKTSMETMAFFNESGKGNWTLSMYGTNVGQSMGSIQYKSTRITIWYTHE